MSRQIEHLEGQPDGNATEKHQIGGNYSISQQLRQEIIEDSVSGGQNDGEDGGEDDETDRDVLQQRMRERATMHREDEYHRKRFGRSLTEQPETAQRGEVAPEQGTVAKKQRIRGKSRWDVQTYVPPEQSGDLQKELQEKLRDEVPGARGLRYLKDSDRLHFAQTLDINSIESLSESDKAKKSLLLLLLKIKNGTTPVRKLALKQLTAKCSDFGPKLIFDSLLPILLDKSLEDHERYLMIKVVDRVLYRLGDSVKPYTHNILVVISPLLIDEDPVARTTGREVISNLSSVVGLATIITTLRPDVDSEDEYIRNTTARTFAVVAKALGIVKLLPFINAMCHSKKSWRARHTGVRIIQQSSILLGMGVLPHLTGVIQCIRDGISDEHIPIRILTANTLATLAQNVYPYGIEAFNIILEPLWKGIRHHRGKVLAAFLKCLGSIIPLMDPEYAGYYTHELMRIIKREFDSPDDEMKMTVLLVLQKCSKIENITPEYLISEVAPNFFQNFWIRRVALDKKINKMVTYTTIILSEKLGCSFVIEKLLGPLRDEAEPFRIMAIHAINRVVKLLGSDNLNERLVTRLIDALLISFQDQTSDDPVIFRGFGTVVKSLNTRMHPFLSPIVSTILNQLKHKDQTIRQNAADLCNVMIPVIKNCNEIEMLNKLNIILYESLGEVYPEVLGSIIRCIGTIISVMKLSKLQPPANQILPTLTPILRNKHIKVQMNAIRLIGNIAIRGPSYVSPKEWVRICFELLETLKSPNKKILRATNDTFGYIAKAIGPQDVLVLLLNNLKVQERQSRVSTAVAIGIVAETCGPYTVLPALMNEYRTPETNVQNGILKAMTFMFEYIGSLSQDYIYMITPLIQDALTDRDLVHRQTAATVIKHLAIHCRGSGNEDAFIHLLNLLMPNIFETSPHVISRIIEGLESLCYTLGPAVFLNYIWAGLFHPARNVRRAFWNVYNNVYIQYVDAMVPAFPVTSDPNTRIEEMDIVL